MSTFSIDLNSESAAVLLWCLDRGKNSRMSAAENSNGFAEVVNHNVDLIRSQVLPKLTECIIQETAQLTTDMLAKMRT